MMIVMLLPLIALPVFWLLPLGPAILLYVLCLSLWGSIIWAMRASMKLPSITGVEALIGQQATVTSQSPSDEMSPYRVRIQGETWRARSRDALHRGDTAVIIAVEGNKLTVRKE